ncbi:MAG: aldo/keto reductase [Alteripontixanthobacter sp.]
MKYVNFGNTGLKVSKLCLGCMSIGEAAEEGHDWAMGEDDSRPIIRRALEHGINFFDIANVYSGGTSEEITGRLLKDMARRDEIVIATKAYFPWRGAPNTSGLSAKSLMHAVEDSLTRLGTDYIDLYQIHRFDEETPVEETLETLDTIVRHGKARYIGASSMAAWQLMKMLHVSELKGLKRFASMQNYLNLLYREEEREMLPLCQDQGIAVMPWSPLARGKLTRPWGDTTQRDKTDRVGKALYKDAGEVEQAIVGEVQAVAGETGASMAQVALAWMLAKPEVTTPIIGATSVDQLDDTVGAIDVQLSGEQISRLESPYKAQDVKGMFSLAGRPMELSPPR